MQLGQVREVKDIGAKLRRLYKKLEYENSKYTLALNHGLSSVRSYRRRFDLTNAKISNAEVLYIQRHGRAFRGRRISVE